MWLQTIGVNLRLMRIAKKLVLTLHYLPKVSINKVLCMITVQSNTLRV